jgi:hypothetical protein
MLLLAQVDVVRARPIAGLDEELDLEQLAVRLAARALDRALHAHRRVGDPPGGEVGLGPGSWRDAHGASISAGCAEVGAEAIRSSLHQVGHALGPYPSALSAEEKPGCRLSTTGDIDAVDKRVDRGLLRPAVGRHSPDEGDAHARFRVQLSPDAEQALDLELGGMVKKRQVRVDLEFAPADPLDRTVATKKVVAELISGRPLIEGNSHRLFPSLLVAGIGPRDNPTKAAPRSCC